MDAKSSSAFQTKWSLLISDAWDDQALQKRLISDPAAVLKERGIRVAPGVQIKVLADNDTTAHLVIPVKPDAGQLSEEQLSTVAAGNSHHSFHSFHSHHCGGCHNCHHNCHHFGG